MKAVFKVLKPGLLTTVQDLGRFGSRHIGVPVGGAVDTLSFRIANALVGNSPEAACLESTVFGPKLLILADCIIAITGAEMDAKLSGKPVPMWQSFYCSAGQILQFGSQKKGCRGYIAISGGIEVPIILGSRSTLLSAGFGGYRGRPLLKGDVVRVGESASDIADLGKHLPEKLRPVFDSHVVIRVLRGINANAFTEAEYKKLFSQSFIVTKRQNRMGCCLETENPIMTERRAVNVSYPVTPGSIQVPPSGQPIVLLNDAQSTGGYHQIACVASGDLWKMGQVMPGDTVSFREIGLVEAGQISKKQRLPVEGIKNAFSAEFIKQTGKASFRVRVERKNLK